MKFAVLVSLTACSSAAIPLSIMLIYHEITNKASRNEWEKTLAVFLEIFQMGLSGTCIIAAVVALRSNSYVYWYDAVALCNLQLFVGNNVGPHYSSTGCADSYLIQLTRILRSFLYPGWMIWLVNVLIVLTASDIIHMAMSGSSL
jgi:hypothetical protein